MKLIALGDTHGRSNWKKIVEKNDFDKVVFIGDYFDSFDIPGIDQLLNFEEICKYKRDNFDKVVLLVGNHDYHYWPGIGYQGYSGYQGGMKTSFEFAINENIKLFQMCYIDSFYCFTHAGITKTWLENNNIVSDLEASVNELFFHQPRAFRFNGYDPYGDNITQSPIWVRPYSLMRDGIAHIIQVMGHTTQDRIIPRHKNDLPNRFWYIDTLGTSGEYLQIVDGVASAIKLED